MTTITEAVAVQDLAPNEPGDGLQADVGVRADVGPRVDAGVIP